MTRIIATLASMLLLLAACAAAPGVTYGNRDGAWDSEAIVTGGSVRGGGRQ